MTLTEALARSLNSAAVRLAQQVGVSAVTAAARRLGIHASLTPDLSLALGSSGVPMMEMVGAYAVLANGGRSVHPYAVERIAGKDGRVIYQRIALNPGPPMFDPRALEELDSMLQTVIREGTGRGASLGEGIHAAGKTGTSQEFRDAWFIGYTACCVAGVWIGNDDNTPMKKVTGGSIPARVWHDVMQAALQSRGSGHSWFSFLTPSPDAPPREESGGFTDTVRHLFNN